MVEGRALLNRRERRQAGVVLGVVILAAFSSAGMIGSVMPFLSVLSDPHRISTVPQLAWLYGSYRVSQGYTYFSGGAFAFGSMHPTL